MDAFSVTGIPRYRTVPKSFFFTLLLVTERYPAEQVFQVKVILIPNEFGIDCLFTYHFTLTYTKATLSLEIFLSLFVFLVVTVG